MRRPAPVSEARAADPGATREAALKLLERTRRTRADLTRKLQDKGYAAPVVASVIDRLAEVGLVDDVEFARAFLAGRWGRRAAGWRKLEIQLRQKGIGAADIAEARRLFEETQGAVDEVGAARRVIEQSARRYDRLEPRVRRQRLWALLTRRGFSGETIEQALREREAAGA